MSAGLIPETHNDLPQPTIEVIDTEYLSIDIT